MDGELSLKEFTVGVRKLGYRADGASIAALFRSWDVDGSGAISMIELNKILRRGGTVRLADAIRFDPEAAARRSDEEKRKKVRGLARRMSLNANRMSKEGKAPAMNNDQEKLLKKMAKQKEKLLAFFQSWDTNRDGFINRHELHKSLPLTGLSADRATVDALFDSMDYAETGKIAIDHLQSCLRWAAKSNESKILHINLDEGLPPLEQIRDALQANAARVIDLFREFDENGDGEISLQEFERAMPMLGVPLDRDQAKELFDLFDVRRAPPPRATAARHRRPRRAPPPSACHRRTGAATSAFASSTSCCGATRATNACARRR